MSARTPSLVLGVCLALSAAPAAAEDLGRLQAHFGDAVYQLYCAACHGQDGKGDGPAAPALRTRPADLTGLAKRNGGVFPIDRVTAAIDGRLDIDGHLDLPIPPLGHSFTNELKVKGTLLEQLIARRIAHIVAYLESLQEK
jgi:hypothetical protein